MSVARSLSAGFHSRWGLPQHSVQESALPSPAICQNPWLHGQILHQRPHLSSPFLLPPAQSFPDKMVARWAPLTLASVRKRAINLAILLTGPHSKSSQGPSTAGAQQRMTADTQPCRLLASTPNTWPGGAGDPRQAPSSFGSQSGRWRDCKWHQACCVSS